MLHIIADNTPIDILGWIQKGGIVGLLAAILFGGTKGWWYFGREVRTMQERIRYLEHSNAKWMELAFKSTKIVDDVLPLIRDESTS